MDEVRQPRSAMFNSVSRLVLAGARVRHRRPLATSAGPS